MTTNEIEIKANEAELKLREAWLERGLNPDDIYIDDENGDLVFCDLAQDIFNDFYI